MAKNDTDKIRLLLAEDDTNFGDVLKSYLEMHDYDVKLAPDGEKALENFTQGHFDLCIFDVMMPKKDGFTLAEEVRQMNQDVPIIFLTAKSMKEDVINGFKIGADDYITKPFNSEELLYRVQAILRRSGAATIEQDEFDIGSYNFNYPLRILKRGNHKDKLSPKEAELLRLFALKKNQVLERSEALKKIWGEDNYFTARSMDVFVTKLRKYLKEDTDVEIANIHGNGFRLIVRESQES
jgi:DNA-binding response OmpR family regulator